MAHIMCYRPGPLTCTKLKMTAGFDPVAPLDVMYRLRMV